MGDEKWMDFESIHLSSSGLQALGIIYHDLYHCLSLSSDEQEAIIRKVANINWSRDNEIWLKEVPIGTMVESKKEPGTMVFKMSGAGRSSSDAIIQYLRRKTGLQSANG